MRAFSTVKLNTTDLFFDSIDVPGGAVNVMSSSGDQLVLGLDRTFNGVYFQLGETGNYGSNLVWEYLADEDEDNNDSWDPLPLQRGYDFSDTNVVMFPVPNDWVKNNDEEYLIRIRLTANATTPASILRIYPFPTYSYADVEDVERLIQLRRADSAGFTETTTPKKSDVERILARIEGRIEGYSTQAWKPKFRADELYDFSAYGFVMNRQPIIDIIKLESYRSSSFTTLTEGRDSDYHFNPRTGEVTFTRLNTLPFSYNRHNLYGYGAQKESIKVTYVWGKDLDFDDRGYMVQDILVKLTAADLLSSYDFTNLIPQGTDRFSIESRIQRWTEDANERLEELRPVRVFT